MSFRLSGKEAASFETNRRVSDNMLQWLAKLTQRWTSWLGDRDMEVKLRQHLSSEGFQGQGAKFQYLRLVAVQRPGWVQLYSFAVIAKAANDSSPTAYQDPSEPTVSGQTIYGLVRSDERYNRTDIRTFHSPAARMKLFHDWSQDLITLRRPHV